MAFPNTNASGSQTCVITTTHSLATTTTAGIYVAHFNLTNAANGDVFHLRANTKVLTGDTAESIWHAIYAHDLGAEPIVHTPPLVSMFSLEITIQQSDGTGRSIPWALIQIA